MTSNVFGGTLNLTQPSISDLPGLAADVPVSSWKFISLHCWSGIFYRIRAYAAFLLEGANLTPGQM